MRKFDYSYLADRTWDNEIISYISKIHEYKGKQELFLRQKPVELNRLIEIATIQSFWFSSDTIIIEMTHLKNKKIIDQVRERISDIDEYIEHLLHRSYTIGSMVIFPVHNNSMNQRKGTNPRIADRWDLTLECIRRHYAGEESPLSNVIESDKAFYDLFVDFKGYVDFFFMQDCVSEDYSSVDIWIGDASFKENGLPKTVEDYFKFLVKEHIFLDKRNRRIQEYCIEHRI